MVLFGQELLYSGEGGCIRAIVVVFVKKLCYIRAKMLVFEEKVCIRAKWLYLCKSGCIRAKAIVFGQKWLN